MSLFERYIAPASAMAGKVDALFLALFSLSALVIGIISILIVVFIFRYRRGSSASRETASHRPIRRNRPLEITWIAVPLVLFLGIFAWGAVLYQEQYLPPDDALEISVVAKQWMWKFQHPDGQREINELHVPTGRPVRLIMTSQDVIHSFFVPAFRVKQDVLPDRYTSLWFEPTRAGEYQLFCAELCGTDHSRMRGTIIAMNAAAYERWLQAHPGGESLVTRGAKVFRRYGCSGCHAASATVHAPKLAGLYGSPVPLQGGGTVMADEAYIRDSILLPQKQIAAGYPPIMPSFEGQIGEEALLALVAYIKSLAEVEEIPR